MKHKKVGRKLSRVRNQRRALIKTLLGSLIMNEKITTTEAKAKEIKPLADKIINKAKEIQNNKNRKVAIMRNLNNKIPSEAVKKLSGDYIKKFKAKNSGYARIVKLGARKSDSAKMACLMLIATNK